MPGQHGTARPTVRSVRAARRPDGGHVAGQVSSARLPTGPPSLSPAQVRVIGLVAEGLTDVEIGERLKISRSAVSGQVANAIIALSAVNRPNMVAIALRTGVII